VFSTFSVLLLSGFALLGIAVLVLLALLIRASSRRG